ncbi:hypothetical protein CQ10_38080 [Bradyrhizobium valentinum]|uniref:Uncharacterized protein n=1 Tax=Bradyrhizobium valentinum TaxID=1518501 RepID=A0A0R3L5R4_9BRAD|nr:hypothetical protein CQ10_38080 [Bradyrhizobium valentinum]KRR03273.1 hypothetical protein CP49_15165 [Bradyrhizobium valentinum]
MIIDLVFKTSIACGIGTWLAFEPDGASVRQNKPGPDQEYAGLPKRDLAVATADQPRALRNQKIAPSWCVKYILSHPRSDRYITWPRRAHAMTQPAKRIPRWLTIDLLVIVISLAIIGIGIGIAP